MDRISAWKTYDADTLERIEELCTAYKTFISENKTERECCAAAIKAAEAEGYEPLDEVIKANKTLACGDKVWATAQNKAVILVQIGQQPLEMGCNILGAHIDSPRLDIKQNPLFEKDGFALLDTHYYGGIKNYHWVAMPLALHGIVAKKDGSTQKIVIGEDPSDPVFCVTDLLPHLGAKQMAKKGSEVIEGEDLDILIGNRIAFAPRDDASDDAAEGEREHDEKDPVKAFVLNLLKETYGFEDEDFLSAELEIVPAGCARDLGLDRSMVIGYGQDDRVCAFTSLVAQLELAQKTLAKTAVCILVDKEEIGSVGASGMESAFFENTMAEIMELTGNGSMIALRRALQASKMLSSDVSAGVDPAYESVFETKNAAYLGRGLVFSKYTGSRGKSGSNDARAEFIAELRRVMDADSVNYQTAELGRVDAGGGGTIAYVLARFGMDVIDSGVTVLSMHSPWEVTSKADIYEAKRGYQAFLEHM